MQINMLLGLNSGTGANQRGGKQWRALEENMITLA